MADKSAIQVVQAAYEAYAEDAGWKSYGGDPLPQWKDLAPRIRRHWVKAVSAALKAAEG